MKKPLTIRDIALQAGVSLGTVSRVMNNAANVDPELRERTLTAIQQSNYIPLRRPRRNSRRNAAEGGRIAVLFCDMSYHWHESYFSRSYVEAINKICEAYRVQVEYFSLLDFADNRFFQRLLEYDGILFKHSYQPGDERVEQINTLMDSVPVVGFGSDLPAFRCPQIYLDNRAAGALAAEELIRRGHRSIAFISTNPGNPMFANRGIGFRETMQRYGLWTPGTFFERKIATVSTEGLDPVPPLLDKTLDKILSSPQKVTAAVVVNDWGCVGLYRACAQRGIRIPDELSVLGFDNQISICASLTPLLSSISNPLAGIGETAAWELISRIDAKSRGVELPLSSRLFSGTLVERNSIIEIETTDKEAE